MPCQKQKKPGGAGRKGSNNEHKIASGATSSREIRLIADILERGQYKSKQQQQAIVRLHQLILDAHQAATPTFLEASDEATELAFLASFEALAATPIFEDDTAPYREAMEAARKIARLIVTRPVTVVESYGRARDDQFRQFQRPSQQPTCHAIEQVLSRLDKVKPSGQHRWRAICPSHPDRNPSLSVRELEDGTVLIKCWTGCSIDEIVAAIGINLCDLFPGKHPPALRPSKAAVEHERMIYRIGFEMQSQGRLEPIDQARFDLAKRRLGVSK